MGCSASRSSTTFLTTSAQDQPSNPSSSHSPYCSHSDDNSSPTLVSRTLSLPTPLVHHPPQRKGDSHHLVSLTSTTYGSLILVDQTPIANPKIGIDIDPEYPSSPDSVINTWELMEGLDDFEFDLIEKPSLCQYKFCKGSMKKVCDSLDSFELVEHSDSKPLWKHMSEALSSRQLVCNTSRDVDCTPVLDVLPVGLKKVGFRRKIMVSSYWVVRIELY